MSKDFAQYILAGTTGLCLGIGLITSDPLMMLAGIAAIYVSSKL